MSLRPSRRVAPWFLFLALCACSGGDKPSAPAAAGASGQATTNDPKNPTSGLRIKNPADPESPWNFDLGSIPYGETRELAIELENIDGRELRIQSIQPGCTCTTPSVSYVDASGERVEGDPRQHGDVLRLPAGATATLLLRVDTRINAARNNRKRVRTIVSTDSPTNPYLALEIGMLVDQAYYVVPAPLLLGEVAAEAGARAQVKVVAARSDAPLPTGEARAPAGVEATIAEDPLAPGQWIVDLVLHPPMPLGPFEHRIEFATADAAMPIRVDLQGIGVPTITCDPAHWIFDRATAGATAELELAARLPGQRVRVLGARGADLESGLLSFHASPIEPDGQGRSARWTLRLFAARELPSSDFGGDAVVLLDDPVTPEVALRYVKLARP